MYAKKIVYSNGHLTPPPPNGQFWDHGTPLNICRIDTMFKFNHTPKSMYHEKLALRDLKTTITQKKKNSNTIDNSLQHRLHSPSFKMSPHETQNPDFVGGM